MTETIELRDKPELKFILNSDELDVINSSDPKNSGRFSYSEIESAKIYSERTSWFVSILSIIVDFFTGGGSGGIFKSKANLTLKTEKKSVKIWLRATEFEKAKKITALINTNKTNTQQRIIAIAHKARVEEKKI
ncbi:hypothetical protein [Gilvibacter sp.]|jgi:hypothetical protein|uniref:hypothetical protein n=1 Tax=Gilvibacter sp. TaxID=2729997 RepID=UPI003B51B7B9